jgi:hypothetical protein
VGQQVAPGRRCRSRIRINDQHGTHGI